MVESFEIHTSKLLDDSGDAQKSGLGGQVANGIEDFLQSTVYSAAQRPINGIVQLADHLGADWKAPELISQPKDNNFETTAGTMAGTILDVAIMSKATGAGLEELGLSGPDSVLSPLASRGLSSGLMGLEMTAMQPVAPGTDYWAAKEKGLGQNVSSFLIMSGVTQPLQKYFGKGAVGTILSNTIAGAAGGVANVGIADLVDWKKPTVDQLGTVATWAELGAVMGTVQVASPFVSAAASRVWKGISTGGSADAPAATATEGNADAGNETTSAKGDGNADAEATAAKGDGNTKTGNGDKSATSSEGDKSAIKSTNNDGSDDADSPKNDPSGKKSAWSRILRTAIRRALMPKQGGAAFVKLPGGGKGSPESTVAEREAAGEVKEPAGGAKDTASANEHGSIRAKEPLKVIKDNVPATASKDTKPTPVQVASTDADHKKDEKKDKLGLPTIELVND